MHALSVHVGASLPALPRVFALVVPLRVRAVQSVILRAALSLSCSSLCGLACR